MKNLDLILYLVKTWDYSISFSNNIAINGEIAFTEIILSKILIFYIVYDTFQDLVDNVKICSDMFKDKNVYLVKILN